METRNIKLTIAGSSSSGNGYILEHSSGEVLLIEAGIPMRKISPLITHHSPNIVGCIVSHPAHGDHGKYVEEYGKRFIVASNEDLKKKNIPEVNRKIVKEGTTFKLGSFRITPFEVYHDVPCFGYLVYHKDMGVLLFATDTFTMPSIITGCTTYMIEANYSDRMLTDNVLKGELSPAQQKRIYTSHMSIGNTLQYLRDCHAENARQIVLIHLSSRNSNPADFERQVASEFGCPVYIAKKNLSIPL